MQKTLDQTNLQIYDVLSEITGLSDLQILDAILVGESVIRCNWRSRAKGESAPAEAFLATAGPRITCACPCTRLLGRSRVSLPGGKTRLELADVLRDNSSNWLEVIELRARIGYSLPPGFEA